MAHPHAEIPKVIPPPFPRHWSVECPCSTHATACKKISPHGPVVLNWGIFKTKYKILQVWFTGNCWRSLNLACLVDCKTVVFSSLFEGRKRHKRDPRAWSTRASHARRASLPIFPHRFYTRSRPFVRVPPASLAFAKYDRFAVQLLNLRLQMGATRSSIGNIEKRGKERDVNTFEKVLLIFNRQIEIRFFSILYYTNTA